MHKHIKAAVILFAITTCLPSTTFAASRGESGEVRRVVDRDDPITRVTKAIKRFIGKLDQPQGPPPALDSH